MKLNATICKATEVVDLVRAAEECGKPFHAVISVEHPCDEATTLEDGRAPRLAQILGDTWSSRQLILVCWDIERDLSTAVRAPGEEIVRDTLKFIEARRPEHEGIRVLFHCRSGRARSTALALVAKSALESDLSAEDAMHSIVALRPIAAFNLAIVQHGDNILGRKGELVQAVINDPAVTERRQRADEARAHQIESRGLRHASLS